MNLSIQHQHGMVDCLPYYMECLSSVPQSYIHLHLIHMHEYHDNVKGNHTVLISMLELFGENMI